jgi:hypothetical protein
MLSDFLSGEDSEAMTGPREEARQGEGNVGGEPDRTQNPKVLPLLVVSSVPSHTAYGYEPGGYMR